MNHEELQKIQSAAAAIKALKASATRALPTVMAALEILERENIEGKGNRG